MFQGNWTGLLDSTYTWRHDRPWTSIRPTSLNSTPNGLIVSRVMLCPRTKKTARLRFSPVLGKDSLLRPRPCRDSGRPCTSGLLPSCSSAFGYPSTSVDGVSCETVEGQVCAGLSTHGIPSWSIPITPDGMVESEELDPTLTYCTVESELGPSSSQGFRPEPNISKKTIPDFLG